MSQSHTLLLLKGDDLTPERIQLLVTAFQAELQEAARTASEVRVEIESAPVGEIWCGIKSFSVTRYFVALAPLVKGAAPTNLFASCGKPFSLSVRLQEDHERAENKEAADREVAKARLARRSARREQ